MTDFDLSHVREHDPNAKEPEPVKIEPPARTPSGVMLEFFRALVSHLGDHPKLKALLDEYEGLTQAPPIEPAPSPLIVEPNS